MRRFSALLPLVLIAFAAIAADSESRASTRVGRVVEGKCADNEVSVSLHWNDWPGNEKVEFFKNPGFLTRCVELSPRVTVAVGRDVVLGWNDAGKFVVLSDGSDICTTQCFGGDCTRTCQDGKTERWKDQRTSTGPFAKDW